VTFAAAPEALSQFTSWSGCDSVSPGGTLCTVTVGADQTVTANFESTTSFTLTVVINAPAGSQGIIVGSIAGNTINCLAGGGPSSVCSQTFAPGTITQVRPSSGEFVLFGRWSGCDSVTGASRCNVTLNSNRTITATFLQ